LRQGLDDVLVQVKKAYRLEDEPDLHTQIDVFEDELNSDKEELMGRYIHIFLSFFFLYGFLVWFFGTLFVSFFYFYFLFSFVVESSK
jgi:hypothetical protein